MITKQDIKDSFYMKDGMYYTTILEVANYEDDEDLVYEAMMEMLDEDELLFAIGDETVDQSTGFLVYKKEKRLIMEYLFKEDDMFEIMMDVVTWIFPKCEELSAQDIAKLTILLEDYIQNNQLNLRLTWFKKKKKMNPKNQLVQSEKDAIELSEKQVKRIKRLAYFWRYVVFVLMPVFMAVGIFLFGSEYGALLGLSTFLFIFSSYLLLGVIYHFRHIYCMYQNANHQVMTPNEIYWNTLKKSDIYGVPLFFLVFSIAGFIVSLLQL